MLAPQLGDLLEVLHLADEPGLVAAGELFLEVQRGLQTKPLASRLELHLVAFDIDAALLHPGVQRVLRKEYPVHTHDFEGITVLRGRAPPRLGGHGD